MRACGSNSAENHGTRRHNLSVRRALRRGGVFAQSVAPAMRTPRLRDASASMRAKATHFASEAVLDEVRQPYGEETFRYLLSVERRRSERSRRSLLLLLVSFRARKPDGDQIDAALAAALFAGLKACVRDVDFLGWYQTGRVAGAVLPQRGDVSSPATCRGIADRAMQKLAEHLPEPDARRLRLRVVEVRPKMRI